jgi:type IV pilus assembly protein PilB
MTQHELCQLMAKSSKLTLDKSSDLCDAVFECIARELSVGEEVSIAGLGTFFTVKSESAEIEDPPGSGKKIITLPEIEPEFEPDKVLVHVIKQAIAENPELFEKEEPEEEQSHELPDMPPLTPKQTKAQPVPEPVVIPSEQPIQKKEKPLGRGSHIEFRDLSTVKVEGDILGLLPQQLAKQYNAVPIDLKEGVLTIAMVDPEDFDTLQVVRKETGLTLKPVLSSQDDINSVLDQYTGLQAELQEVIDHADLGISKKELEEASQEDLQDQTNKNAPTAKIVFSLLRRAVKEKASDVHIEPYEGKVVVRFRVDGILQARVELPKGIQAAVVSRLKILADLKIDEQRLPQDGRFNLIFDHRQIDFRLSTIPVVYGEKVVMRILDKSVGIISLEEVGLSDHGLETLQTNIQRSHGMILVTGPTGSGKTTSLYAVLGKLMDEGVNILTLEDPVEYRIESINQSQVHADIGYTFAAGLRAVVRQDPDVVMLGEIRDQETADMAIHAALTGHVVLSTLHTNDAAGAFPRLIDMHIEPFLMTSSIHTVIAQRLARKLCPDCQEEVKVSALELSEVKAEIARMTPEVKKQLNSKSLKFFKGKGCETCGGKGYKGRIGVFEVLNVTEPIRELILKRSSGAVITEQAIKEGMVTMPQDGIVKALRGQTSLEEVWRVTKE